jgi:ATP-dependent RNA helicase RhlB
MGIFRNLHLLILRCSKGLSKFWRFSLFRIFFFRVRPHPPFEEGKPFWMFDIPEEVMMGIKDAGFVRCSPIQEKALPYTLKGEDIAAQAQTGTGKTAVFLITIFSRLLKLKERDPSFPSALILAPTRELAHQIYQDAKIIGGHISLRSIAVFGGIDYGRQAKKLRDGVDIVIGTPGRVIDFIKQGILRTDKIKIVVIDEADRMLDMGFIKDLRYILNRLPHYEERQSMLFSATLSYREVELAYEFMNTPREIFLESEELIVKEIEQCLFHTGREEKLPLLLGILKRENWTRVLIFANTRNRVVWLARRLRDHGYSAEAITGHLDQKKRLALMMGFKQGDIKILVATDVASRGIHVEDISHVINYDIPLDPQDYIHRIGRTARLGKKGKAITIACEDLVFHLEKVENYLGRKIPVVWAEEDWFERVIPPPESERKAPARPSGPTRKDGKGFRNSGSKKRRMWRGRE